MANTSEKQKIRERYKGISQDALEKIPAIEKKDIFMDDTEKKVGVYARVSTDDPNQTSSFELQQNHYTDLIERRPGWNLYKIYADEGISGTSLKHRDAFKQMIADCHEHKIDLIITKSVSRFARNIYDCIGYVRELAALKPPIGVFFETENLYTLREDSEMALSFIATIAQEESHTKSSSMNLSYEMRFSRGIFLTPELLGYDKDENGNLVINEEEALTVRLIFFMFLFGYSAQSIAETLMQLKRVTKRGNDTWTAGTVMGILQNERYCGDVLAHKTFTPNYLSHKAVKNNGERAQYRQKDHHEAIILRDDFIAVQQIIAYGLKGRGSLLPKIHVIDIGALRGFAILNTRWTGFDGKDYLNAISMVIPDCENEEIENTKNIKMDVGAVDLRGYEIVRGQFFECGRGVAVTMGEKKIWFSAGSLPKLKNSFQIELLFDPIRKLFVVRPSSKDNRNSVTWLYFDGKKYHPKKIPGYGYMSVIYELMGWKTAWSYYAHGECMQNGNDMFILFDLNEAEAVIKTRNKVYPVSASQTDITGKDSGTNSGMVTAIPQDWMERFGNDYYEHAQMHEQKSSEQVWNTQDMGIAAPDKHNLTTTSEREIKEGISSLIETMKKGSAGYE